MEVAQLAYSLDCNIHKEHNNYKELNEHGHVQCLVFTMFIKCVFYIAEWCDTSDILDPIPFIITRYCTSFIF